jgi:hypothetical protein
MVYLWSSPSFILLQINLLYKSSSWWSCYEQDSQWFPLDVFSKLSSLSQVIPRLPLQGSTVPRQMTWDFLHMVHQTPVRITPICPQANSWKEFNEQVWEVFLTYDTVHWIPTTGPLARFTTKYNTHSKLFQFVTQVSVQDLICRILELPYPGFSRYEFHFRYLCFRLDSQSVFCFHRLGLGSSWLVLSFA